MNDQCSIFTAIVFSTGKNGEEKKPGILAHLQARAFFFVSEIRAPKVVAPDPMEVAQ